MSNHDHMIVFYVHIYAYGVYVINDLIDLLFTDSLFY